MISQSITGTSFGTQFASFGTGLLIAILLRYPEIGSINCNQGEQVLNIKFLLKGSYPYEKLRETLMDAWAVFNQMERREVKVCRIDRRMEEVETLVLTRDLASLTFDEMNLSVQIIKSTLGKQLIIEEQVLGEEDKVFQEDMIVQSLAAMRARGAENSLTALRDGGRVLVFGN
ncbi:MAG: hypothetical protein FWF88_05595 [Peptococcaceae bacterium]|jgi:hypothetical protein|nr:hypothetical protein [Peptococcaceae bacterium]MDR2736920.1 hypothetical protein [Gracilibacteraceae bacterium]